MTAITDTDQRRVRERLRREGPGPAHAEIKGVRDRVAARFLRGHGIELGALNFPLGLPADVEVTYVDYLPATELRVHHAHLQQEFVEPDVVDDGETLSSFADNSLDFIAASHFIEHTEDPVATLASHLRKLRPGGIVFLVVPDKRFTFDKSRPTTPIDHFHRDHRQGPDGSRMEHYREWARLVDQVPAGEVDAAAETNASRRFSIHFHTWTPTSFAEFLAYARRDEGLEFEIEHLDSRGGEFMVVLRKPGGSESGRQGRLAERFRRLVRRP